jgi:hypothetical protein
MSPLTNSPRLASNPPNAMLNYLYAVLESECRLALAALGLDPGIGVLRNDTRNRDSLALDVMEAVRPQVDAFVLEWLRRSPLQRKWFFEGRNGNCRLNGEFAGQLAETATLWRQALGPLVEWIARALWNTSNPARERPLATRLTQNRKREAKDILTEDPGSNLLQLGSEQTRAMRRVESLNTLKQSRVDRFDPVAQSRRADSQRRQAAVLKAWNPTEKPDWLDEKFYLRHVQPRLRTIEASRIQAALSVSGSYATRIRTLRQVPNRRHWLTLARLVGISSKC